MRHPAPRITLTLLLALVAAELCVWMLVPLPWMIGPLLSTALASMLRLPTESWTPLRNAGQCTIGAALGLYFTPQVTALVLSLWWAIGLGIVWALALGVAFGVWLHWLHGPSLPGLDRVTSYFSGAIGAASEMTLLAERAGGRTELVAAAHSVRLMVVTLLIPFGMQFAMAHAGLAGVPDALSAPSLPVRWEGLLLLAALATVGVWVMQRLDRANPWFMGALVVAMALTMAGVELSSIPRPLSNAAQLVIGVSLGVRFNPAFVQTAPRWLASVALGTLGLIAVSAGFGAAMAWATGLPLATLILGTAPGGIAEMSITAKVLQLGAPVVTAFQVCRLIAVLVLVEPLYRRHAGRGTGRA